MSAAEHSPDPSQNPTARTTPRILRRRAVGTRLVTPVVALVVTLFIASSHAASQEAALPAKELRELGFGRVTAADGSPWPDAVVHLLHRPDPRVLDDTVADRITTTTDARGRFRAELLPASRYVAWAHEPEAARGPDETRITGFVDRAMARTPIFLTETDPLPRRRFRLERNATWRTVPLVSQATGRGPDTAVVVQATGRGPDTPDWRVVDTTRLDPVDGLYELPIWPWHSVEIGVHGLGWQLWREHLHPRDATRWERGGVGTIEPPPLRTARITLLGAEDGAPIPGVEVLDPAARPGTRPITSDAEGSFLLALASDAFDPSLRLTHAHLRIPGHAETALSNRTLETRDRRQVVQMRQAPAFRGTLRLGGAPVSGALLALDGRYGLPGATYLTGAPRTTRTDAEGRFRIPVPDRNQPVRLTWILSPDERDRLTRALRDATPEGEEVDSDPPPLSPLVVLHEAHSKAPKQPLDLDALQLERLDLTLLDSDGQPAAASTELLLFPKAKQGWRHPLQITPDRRGRVRMLRGGRFQGLRAVARAGDQGSITVLDPAGGVTRATLRCDRSQMLRLRVVDQADAPWSEARAVSIQVNGIEEAGPIWRTYWFQSRRILQMFPHGTRTDPDGTLHVLVPTWPESISLSIRAADGASFGSGEVELPKSADAPTPILVRVRRKPL